MRPDPARHAAAIPRRSGSRRWFLGTIGAASAALPLARMLPAAAETAPPPGSPPASPPVASPAPPATGPEATSEFAADSRTLAELVTRRFGSRMNAAELEAVRADLQDGLESGRVLRDLALTNADEPDVIFQARGMEE